MTRTERRDLYRLLGGILQERPDDKLCAALLEDRALDRLGEAIGGPLGHELRRMHGDMERGPPAWRELGKDYVALFVGPRKKLAPPWESVYRAPERLVMQECEREVARAYAAQRIGFDGMGRRPADHVALELEFCALMVDRGRLKPAVRKALRRFLDHHLLAWVPAFAADIERHAKSEFFRGLAGALAELCAMERAQALPAVHLAVV